MRPLLKLTLSKRCLFSHETIFPFSSAVPLGLEPPSSTGTRCHSALLPIPLQEATFRRCLWPSGIDMTEALHCFVEQILPLLPGSPTSDCKLLGAETCYGLGWCYLGILTPGAGR